MRYWLAAGLLLTCTACGLWDVVVVSRGSRDTVSNVLHEWSLMYPILPLAIGLLLGHIFWPNQSVQIFRE